MQYSFYPKINYKSNFQSLNRDPMPQSAFQKFQSIRDVVCD